MSNVFSEDRYSTILSAIYWDLHVDFIRRYTVWTGKRGHILSSDIQGVIPFYIRMIDYQLIWGWRVLKNVWFGLTSSQRCEPNIIITLCQNSEGRSCGVTCCRKPQGTRRGFNLCVAPSYGNRSVLEFGGPEWCGNYLEMRRKFKRNQIGVLVDYKLRTNYSELQVYIRKRDGMYGDVAKRNQSEYSNLIKNKACQSWKLSSWLDGQKRWRDG